MKVQPPKRALKFLRWFCREDCIEEIEGDLTEIFEREYEQSPGKAKRKFIWSTLKHFRPEFIKSSKDNNYINPIPMIQHNLLITYRSFLRYKSSFVINLVGLSAGLAAVLLIYLWVYDEISIDKFHKNDERLFQVLRNIPNVSGVLGTHESNSVLFPPALQAEMPEVESVVPVRPAPPGIVSADQNYIKATGWFAGKNFFDAFSYRLIEGNNEQVLQEKHAIVIADELAVKLFGSVSNCIGKSIEWDIDHFGGTHVVTGVFEKPATNSSAQFDFVVAYEQFLEKNRMDVSWNSNPILTYITLKTGVDVEEFNTKLNAFYHSKRPEDVKHANAMFIQRYSDRYLYGHFEDGKQSGGRIDYVILFSIIALFILVIACINFMNLSTARASRRLKEVGIKKAIGVLRRTLVFQHLEESMALAFLSLFVAVLLVFLLLPQFDLITGKQLAISYDWGLITGALVIVLFTGLVSGSYPAFYLSGFKPVEVLKGRLNTSLGELWIRKGLVVFQFSISLLLIVGVVIVYRQMNFVQSKNLGYTKDNIISFERQGKLNQSLESFLAEARSVPGVVNASSASESITNIISTSSGHTWEGQQPGVAEIEFSGINVNFDFIETTDITMMEGRSFSTDFGKEESAVILNQAAIEAMGLADPVGKWIELFGTRREIIGITNDFHFRSMYEEIKPLFIICGPKYTSKVVVKIRSGDERQTIAGLEALHKKYNPGIPFEFKFIDDEYHALYESERQIAQLSKGFAAIAILISCLGLFGLVAFTAERRTKEIGIRKILGCSEFMIINLLSKDFTRLVATAIAITLPVAYFIAKYWLETFAYRIDLKWWYFAGAGLSTLLIAWLTVGLLTVKASRVNPVDCLRME